MAISTVSNKKNKIINIDKLSLKVTNWDKIYFPEDHISKGDVVAYYDGIFKYIHPYLKDRPQSLKRNPDGILSKGFFQKDAPENTPEWVKTFRIFSVSVDRDTNYIICNDKATLLYLNNLGCIEINTWFSRIQHLYNPDYMVIDIDPSSDNTFNEVIDVALAVKQILDKAMVDSFCKTSGATGLHIYVPLGAKYTFDIVKSFAKKIALLTHQLVVHTTSLERSLHKRGNKIYIDYLQNSRGQTLVIPYSLRPRSGAPISAPLLWSEVKYGLHPMQFNLKTINIRLNKMGDIFSGVLGRGIDLNKSQRLLNE